MRDKALKLIEQVNPEERGKYELKLRAAQVYAILELADAIRSIVTHESRSQEKKA